MAGLADDINYPSCSVGNGRLQALAPSGLSFNGTAWVSHNGSLTPVQPRDVVLAIAHVPGLKRLWCNQGLPWYEFDLSSKLGTGPEWRSVSRRVHEAIEHGATVFIIFDPQTAVELNNMLVCLLSERGLALQDIKNRIPGLESIPRHINLPPGKRALFASLLGGAVGDSLGADVEFMSYEQIRSEFPYGLNDLPIHQGLRGAITDDTQMTLFTLEGMIRASDDLARGDLDAAVDAIQRALLRWYRTQGGSPTTNTDNDGLIEDRRLWVRRAPGLTCLSGLNEAGWPSCRASNESKGCGTIMRVAPIALLAPDAYRQELCIRSSAITHGHATAHYGAFAWADMLASVRRGTGLEEAATRAVYLCSSPEGSETVIAIQKALDAPRDGKIGTVAGLGEGWTAEEALSIALYACLTAKTVEDGWRIAVTHSGDSDSTGAIAGNMLGLLFPEEVLGHPWGEAIECVDLMFHLCST
jgi:ADP-ribosylglycohydrolase